MVKRTGREDPSTSASSTQNETTNNLANEGDNMKNELKDYIKNISLKNSSPNDTTPIV